jgi:mannose-1-phosphate guanylyltransferase
VHYAVEPEPLDTAGAIAFAARSVDVSDTFIVANGDIATDLCFADLVEAHRRFGGAATIHLTAVEDPSVFGVVEIDDAGSVRRFVEKPAPGESDSNLVNAGSYVLEPSVLDLIPSLERMSVERVVFPKLVDDGSLFGLATGDYWLDAGRPDQYLQANLDLINGARSVRVDGVHPDAIVHGDAIVVESVIGPGASVAAGARVTESLLLPGADVATGAVVRRSIVAGSVGADCVVTDAVIGAGHHVPPTTTVTDQRLPDTP